ncbi:C-C chemokine receptor type 4-like [Salminus brasiliensis]|uniref:C-C chemokine receptor type 4-like n=1 Tax=Salminus brasiliensis TaxID=930266 RepID=UPI003B834E2F
MSFYLHLCLNVYLFACCFLIADNNSQPCSNDYLIGFSQVFLPTLYSIVFIVGTLGNGLVLCVLAKSHQRSNMMDVCLLNLALSDLLFLVTLPFWAHYGATKEWTFGGFMCHAVTALHKVGFHGSIFFMLLMTIDRYVVTVHAHSALYFKRRSARVGVALVLFMWALSVGASLPDTIFSKVNNDSSRWMCELDQAKEWKVTSYIQLNVLGFLLPLLIMGFCYSQIIPILVTMKSKKKYKAIKLILAVVIIFFLCWTPYNVVAFLHILFYSEVLDSCEWWGHLSMTMQWVETIAYSHCCLNPLIYAFMGQRFRTLVVKTLKGFPTSISPCNMITSERTVNRSSMRYSVTYTTTVV